MTKLFGILAIVAAICFGTLITLQVMELVHYNAEPTVWVKTGS